jgi:bifunctional non-homologous end joining protein LigD
MYARRIRAGLVAESRRALLSHFAELRIEHCRSGTFRNGPRAAGPRVLLPKTGKCRWIAPRLVVAVEFLEWTPELRLRHPRFVGLRPDKDTREGFRE